MTDLKPKHFHDWRIIELIAALLFLPWMCLIFSNACPSGAFGPMLTIFVWLCIALSLSIRLMLPGRLRRQYRFRSTHRAVRIILDWAAPVLLLISLVVSIGLGRSIRFELSKDAFAQIANELEQQDGDWESYLGGEWKSIHRQVGLFDVNDVARYDNTLYFSTGYVGMFFDECGFAFSPDGPLEDRPALICLGHMSGHWYRYHFIE